MRVEASHNTMFIISKGPKDIEDILEAEYARFYYLENVNNSPRD